MRRRAFITSAGAGAIAFSMAGRRARAAPSGGGFDVAVVGAGTFGAWTAWHLARAGRRVVLADAYGTPSRILKPIEAVEQTRADRAQQQAATLAIPTAADSTDLTQLLAGASPQPASG